MGLDIRWPIGLMFTLIGVLLAAFGTIKASDSILLDININQIWGIVLLIFGVFMLLGAISGKKKSAVRLIRDEAGNGRLAEQSAALPFFVFHLPSLIFYPFSINKYDSPRTFRPRRR